MLNSLNFSQAKISIPEHMATLAMGGHINVWFTWTRIHPCFRCDRTYSLISSANFSAMACSSIRTALISAIFSSWYFRFSSRLNFSKAFSPATRSSKSFSTHFCFIISVSQVQVNNFGIWYAYWGTNLLFLKLPTVQIYYDCFLVPAFLVPILSVLD